MSRKIKNLLQQWPPKTVATLRWLRSHGVDRRLADKYVRSGWLSRLGHGAYLPAGASVDWPGAIHALQTQLDLNAHPGAITAIELRGYAHYLAFGSRNVFLFGQPGTRLPAWFDGHSWSRPITLHTTSVLGRTTEETSSVPVDGVELEVASLERAAFELMYLVPTRQSYTEALEIFESLTTLRPRVVQRMLESSTSVKTKRLFMHAAERAHHPWLTRLDLSKVDFGSGRRTLHAGGRLDEKYDLIVADPEQD